MKLYIVLERWNIDLMETDANVFFTEQEAKAYADEQAKTMLDIISGSTIKHEGDENFYGIGYVCVDRDDGMDDEWWEARILKKQVKE